MDGTAPGECVPVGDKTTYRIASDGTEVTFKMIGMLTDVSLPPFETRYL